MLKDQPTGRLFLGGALGLALVVTLCALGLSSYAAAVQTVEHTVEVREQSYQWGGALVDVETNARAYLSQNADGVPASYDDAIRRERGQEETLRSLVSYSPEQLRNIDAAAKDANAVVASLDALVALARAGKRDEARAKLSTTFDQRARDAFRVDGRVIRAEETRLLGARRSDARTRGIVALAGGLFITFASCALLWAAGRRAGGHDRRVTHLANEAHGRLDALSDLASALSEARTRADVASVIVDQGKRFAGADICTIHELDATGLALDLVASRGVAPELLAKIEHITETAGSPETFASMTANRPMWVESETEYADTHPDLASMRAEGPRAKAFWTMPLVVAGRAVGLLGVGFHAPRTFPPSERAFVETLARHCAQALLRAAGREREDEARRWLATTLRSIGDAVIATDADARITFMNPVAETVTGWTEDEARGLPISDVFAIFSEETRQPVESPVTKVLREGVIVAVANHTVLRPRSGAEIPIDDSGAPIRSESGRVLGAVLVFRDVTLQKRARVRSEFLAKAGEALVASLDYEATLGTVARLAVPALADWCAVALLEPGATVSRQVAVAHVDSAKIEFVRALGERYPTDPDATTGVPQVIRSGKSELYPEIPRELLERAARDAEHLRMIQELKLESAMTVPLRAHERTFGAITFVHADSGRRFREDDLAFAEDFARRAALAIENAVALRETEAARVKEHALRADAELASRAKDEFLATVSHELRTPLNAILGWTVMLRRHKLEPEVDRGLVVVERNARAQATLIEEVLDISRVISGKLALNLGPTNVAEALAAAIDTVTPAAEAKEITVATEASDPALTIKADPDRLQQIIWNLLSNAVKFTPKGGHVRVEARREGSDVLLTVTDDGEGIRGDVLPLVFEPFHQGDASTTRRHGGLGLGLAIVKQLVSAHGGTVRAESAGLKKGSTFTVRVPARSAVPAVERGSRAQSNLAPPEVNEGGSRLTGLRIVVVDDEQDALDLVVEVLRTEGAEVYAAASAREALALVTDLRPDVLVSDVGMPEVDGHALIRQVRALPLSRGGATPAVALTAYARSEDADRAVAAGFQMHVAKPVEPSQLVTVVANLGGMAPEVA
jgi:PAS domain S-box-containing protein